MNHLIGFYHFNVMTDRTDIHAQDQNGPSEVSKRTLLVRVPLPSVSRWLAGIRQNAFIGDGSFWLLSSLRRELMSVATSVSTCLCSLLPLQEAIALGGRPASDRRDDKTLSDSNAVDGPSTGGKGRSTALSFYRHVGSSGRDSQAASSAHSWAILGPRGVASLFGHFRDQILGQQSLSPQRRFQK